MRLLLLITCVLFSGCKPSPPPSTRMNFGDGDAILQSVLDPVLVGYTTQFPEISWSGHGGSGEFSVGDSLTIKETKVEEISAKLSTELAKLPAKRSWDSHGSGISGSEHLEVSYEEDGDQFYFDFVLFQQDRDVRLLILHKGVHR